MPANVQPYRAEIVSMRPGVIDWQGANLGREFEAASRDDRQVIVAEGCVYVLDQHVDLSLNGPTSGTVWPMGGDTRAA